MIHHQMIQVEAGAGVRADRNEDQGQVQDPRVHHHRRRHRDQEVDQDAAALGGVVRGEADRAGVDLAIGADQGEVDHEADLVTADHEEVGLIVNAGRTADQGDVVVTAVEVGAEAAVLQAGADLEVRTAVGRVQGLDDQSHSHRVHGARHQLTAM